MFRIQSTHKRVHHEEPAIATFLIGLAVASTPGPLQGQQFEYAKQAEFDEKGNIYAATDTKSLIRFDAEGKKLKEYDLGGMTRQIVPSLDGTRILVLTRDKLLKVEMP